MDLHRVTPDAFESARPAGGKYLGQSSDGAEFMPNGWLGDLRPMVRTHFKRFGGGDSRKSDFEVHCYWDDVEQLIQSFSDAGHPQAVEICEAIKLARAVKQAGWEPKNSN